MKAHGNWLKEARQLRGWSVQRMVRELHKAAASVGDTLPDSDVMVVMIYRWEHDRSGISERYRRHYCNAFRTPLDGYGDPSIFVGIPAGISAVIGRSQRDRLCFALGYLAKSMTIEPQDSGEQGD